jgi:hypothetical protein
MNYVFLVRPIHINLQRNQGEVYSIQSVPPRLIFTYRFDFFHHPNLLEGGNDESLMLSHQNVLKTVNSYNASLNGTAIVVFLDHGKCRQVIEEVFPMLVQYFDIERGKFQSDMCRVAELYKRGGYYFDIDLETVLPMIVPKHIEFVSVITETSGLFAQGFIASWPGNRILWNAFLTMLNYYKINGVARNDDALMGPRTLLEAYQNTSEINRGAHYLLKEINLEKLNHTEVESKLRSGHGGSCNYVICESPALWTKIYFYSRFVGASKWCSKP